MNSLWPYPVPGIPDDVFERGAVPMTKREVRALTICTAKLKPALTVWDVGAGTGSLSVEAALFTPGGQVFAVEKKVEGLYLIARNRERFNLENLTPIAGEAPDVLVDLPDPERILVGGSGGRLAEILDVCAKRLLPGGVIVVNVISPRNLTVVLDALHKSPYMNVEGVYLQASRLEKLGQEDVFRAQNGVWIISAEKEGSHE